MGIPMALVQSLRKLMTVRRPIYPVLLSCLSTVSLSYLNACQLAGVNLPTVTLSGSSSDHVPGAASTEQRVQAPPVKTVLSELMMGWSQY